MNQNQEKQIENAQNQSKALNFKTDVGETLYGYSLIDQRMMAVAMWVLVGMVSILLTIAIFIIWKVDHFNMARAFIRGCVG